MQGRFAKLTALFRHWLGRLRPVAQTVIRVAIRGWQWLMSLDIPLSPLQWILLFFLVFGVIYALATPVFEANEEIWHFGYVEHLRKSGALPEQVFDGVDTIYRQHGSQPPLYYGIMALVTAPLDIDDAESYRRLNPHVTENQPNSFGNKNLVVRDESRTIFGGTSMAVLIMRAIGLALGAATIVFVHKIGELVSPQRPTVAFAAAAFTGLNPMFIFVCASVNNDTLSMLFNGAIVLLMLRMLRDGFALRYTIVIALLFALTSLTKLTGLVLLPVLFGAALFAFRKKKDRRGLLLFLYSLALCWLLIAGWWYVRNVQLYGEPFGMITMANIAGPRGVTFNLADLFAEYQHFRMSYWGLFGALNIQVTSIFYLLLDLMTFLSAIGCVFLLLQLLAISDFAYARYELSHLLTLCSALILLWIGVLYWSSLTRTSEGRMLFPLIAVVSPLLAVGFVEVVWWIVFSLRPPNLEFVRAGDAVPKELLHDTMLWQLRFLGVVAFFAPFTVIASQYSAPQPIVTLPDRARPVYAEYGDVALIAYEHSDRRYTTGDKVRLKLYWQVLEQSPTDNSIILTLVDDRTQEIGSYATFPGAGSLRTSSWQAGAIYPDEYLITISQAAYGRYPFDLRVEWENIESDDSIAATNAENETIAPVLLDIGAVVTARFQASTTGFSEIPVDSQPVFDEVIRLEAFQLDLDLNEIALRWKSESAPDESYTVFAHLLDTDGIILTQDDVAPRLPTEYWRWGESFTTYHRFDPEYKMLDYKVIVGLYLNDGLTLPRAEFVTIVEDEEEEKELLLDSYTIPWDMAIQVIDMTATAEYTPESDEDGAPDPDATEESNQSDSADVSDEEP